MNEHVSASCADLQVRDVKPSMTRLDLALKMAGMGCWVLPIQPGKKRPYLDESWSMIMTTDPEKIRRWFAERPDMNYGICPGKLGVILDPDEDERKGKHGLAQLQSLEAEQSCEDAVLGCTFTVKSPRGGRHLYLKTPYSVSNAQGDIGNDIDVRGFGGYVVGPGSHTVDCPEENTAEGTYEIEFDLPIMDAPEWVMNKLATALAKHKDADKPPPQGWDTEHAITTVRAIIARQTAWPVQGEHGDIQTYTFLQTLKDYGVSAEKAFELLNEPAYADGKSWNDSCQPSWTTGELEQKFENVYRYGLNQPGSKGGTLESLPNYGADLAQEAIEAAAVEQLSKLDAITFKGSSLINRKVNREMVIPGWLIAHGITALLAVRGTGKTVAMVDMACRLACDMDWHGTRMKKGFCAVYLCGEDDEGLQAQMKAWHLLHKQEMAEDRFIAITGVPNLMSAENVETFTRHILSKAAGRRIVLFFDTWQRGTSHASQNDDKDIQNAFHNVEAMMKSLTGCAVIAFHPPKNNPNTILGSSVIENNTVGIWTMVKAKNQTDRELKVQRLKAKGEGNGIGFEFREIGFGECDEFGVEYTGVVAVKIGQSKENGGEIKYTVDTGARATYATVIARLWLKHEDDVQEEIVPRKPGDFSSVDAARRVQDYLNSKTPDSLRSKTMLAEARDKGWEVSDDQFARYLIVMFVDNPAPQRTHDGDTLVVEKKGRYHQFRITKELKPDSNGAVVTDDDLDF